MFRTYTVMSRIEGRIYKYLTVNFNRALFRTLKGTNCTVRKMRLIRLFCDFDHLPESIAHLDKLGKTIKNLFFKFVQNRLLVQVL